MLDLEKLKQDKSIEDFLRFSIINVDKPDGMTSFTCVDKVRRILGAKKAGHFGTLDPMVTGVLPVALNKACRLSGIFMKKEKEYVGTMHIHSEISDEILKTEMEKLIGKIMQLPPRKSSVKREIRERNVERFEIITRNGKDIEFSCRVEAGTYIRKLIHDLGEKIGGAHMIKLRRIRAGIFSDSESHGISEIEDAFKKYKDGDEKKLREILIPAEIIIKIIPSIEIEEAIVKEFLNGRPILKRDNYVMPDSKFLAIVCKNQLIEVSEKVEREDIIAKPYFVLN